MKTVRPMRRTPPVNLDRYQLRSRTRAPCRAVRLLAGALTTLCILATFATSAFASTVVAASIGGPTPFGLTPAPAANGQAPPYFTLSLAPGQSATHTVVVTNLGKSRETLKLSRSTGTTAPNSASAFDDSFVPCVGTGCWVGGIPPLVTLAAGTSKSIPFTVTVPARVPAKQYLAGITVEIRTPPAPVVVGRNGRASARAIVIDQVSVGVAVTVGALAGMKTSLQIPAVTGGADGSIPRIYVQLHNIGQTFTHARGTAWCVVKGTRVSMPVTSDTVLPGQRAVLPINALGVGLGTTVPCTVRLDYGAGLIATWSGNLTTPTVATTKIVHTGLGTYSNLPAHTGVPTWVVIATVIGALLLVAIACMLLLLLLRRRRRHREARVMVVLDPLGDDAGPAEHRPAA
jgi:hypothetical protein